MAATSLVDTYQRYKKGTSKLVSWLCESAQSCGLGIASTTSRGKTTKVVTADLPKYADAIVAAVDPKIEITYEILDIARDVIEGRKSCRQFYLTVASPDKASNQRHAHFIKILDTVYESLRREYKSRLPKRKKKIPAHAADTNDLSNLFSHLGLEETAPEEVNVDSGSFKPSSGEQRASPSSKQTTLAEHHYELEDSEEEDRSFAIWCLLNDCRQLHTKLLSIWQMYADGEMTFLCASKLTEYAFGLILNLTEDFGNRHPDLKSYDDILDFLEVDGYFGELDKEDRATSQLDDLKSREISDSLYLEAFYTLTDYEQLVMFRMFPDHSEWKEGVPTMSFLPGPFGQHLLSMTGDFMELTAFARKYNARKNLQTATKKLTALRNGVDCFTRVMIEITLFNRKVDAASVFFLQIYSDIYEKIDGHLQRGVLESKDALNRVHAIVERAQKFYQQKADYRSSFHYHEEGPTLLCSIEKMMQPDQTQDDQNGWTLRSCGCDNGEIWVPSSIVDKLPLLPARFANLMLSRLQRDGADHCSSDCLVLSTAHLHNAAALIGCLQKSWLDLDYLVAAQNASKALLRKGDGSLQSAAKQFSLALGVPLVQVARGKKPRLPNASRIDKLAASVDRIDLVQDACDALHVHNSSFTKTDIFYESIRRHASRGSMKDPAVAAQWKNSKKLEVSQLLDILTEITVEEEPYLNFDYWTFADNCALWMGRILDTLHLARGQHTELDTWDAAHEVMWSAAEAEARGRSLQTTLLYRTGLELDKMLEDGTIVTGFVTPSMELSSGHIPEHLKPKNKYAGKFKVTTPDLQAVEIVLQDESRTRAECQLELWRYERVLEKLQPTFDEWWKQHGDEPNASAEYSQIVIKAMNEVGMPQDTLSTVQGLIDGIKSKYVISPSKILRAGMLWKEKVEDL